MVDSFNAVEATATQYKTSQRIGAYIVAVGRVAAVYKLRGTYA
jgi:glutamate dehydrogenase/leucine dehydrogenase